MKSNLSLLSSLSLSLSLSHTDVDECVLGNHNCDENADCMDIEGSFYCICSEGYAGSGTICMSTCSNNSIKGVFIT